jgi:purine-binding chemotaxis protein CheW
VDIYKKFKLPHDGLHLTAIDLLKLLKFDKHAAINLLENKITPHLKTLLTLLEELADEMNKRAAANQRVLFVEIEKMTIGLLVDRVSEVARLSRSFIDTTPAVISSYGKEIKAIAKLNEGTRLILLINETQLLSNEEMTTIMQIQQEREKDESPGVETKIKDRKMVVFSAAGEEFGVCIDNVQEIFKTREITPVPKAPGFIKGVTNLRGNIIPVVDVKERFGIIGEIEKKQVEARHLDENNETILVTLIKDTTVGILVENVNEVLRIPEDQIEDAPSLVQSNLETGYLEGIAKMNQGGRIILLLTLDQLMSTKEFAKLKKIKQSTLGKKNKDKYNGTTKKKIS